MRLWPTTVLTPDDWIGEVTLEDGTRTRVGVSPHLTEAQAIERIRTMLGWRKRWKVVDIRLRRRVHAFASVTEMHEENRGRLVK